jgi:hypothetical protein
VGGGIAQGLNVVKVAVADVRVEHEVRLKDLTPVLRPYCFETFEWIEFASNPPELSFRFGERRAGLCLLNQWRRLRAGARV